MPRAPLLLPAISAVLAGPRRATRAGRRVAAARSWHARRQRSCPQRNGGRASPSAIALGAATVVSRLHGHPPAVEREWRTARYAGDRGGPLQPAQRARPGERVLVRGRLNPFEEPPIRASRRYAKSNAMTASSEGSGRRSCSGTRHPTRLRNALLPSNSEFTRSTRGALADPASARPGPPEHVVFRRFGTSGGQAAGREDGFDDDGDGSEGGASPA